MMPNDTDNAMRIDTIGEKMLDAETPGFYALFTDEEAAKLNKLFHFTLCSTKL